VNASGAAGLDFSGSAAWPTSEREQNVGENGAQTPTVTGSDGGKVLACYVMVGDFPPIMLCSKYHKNNAPNPDFKMLVGPDFIIVGMCNWLRSLRVPIQEPENIRTRKHCNKKIHRFWSKLTIFSASTANSDKTIFFENRLGLGFHIIIF